MWAGEKWNVAQNMVNCETVVFFMNRNRLSLAPEDFDRNSGWIRDVRARHRQIRDHDVDRCEI